MKFNFSDNYEFEAFVRKIATQHWDARGYSGAITVDGKERDGILESRYMIYCLEVTTSKTANHTRESCEKLCDLVNGLREKHPDKGVTAWYITRFEPTGEQGVILSRHKAIVNHRTYEAFYSSIVDAKDYLIEREKKPFGSIRGPEDGRFDADLKYTPTKILDADSGQALHTAAIAKQIAKGPIRALLLGEYGAGKSMSLRDIFQRLSLQYRNGSDSQFPVYVNLRDHIEQYDPDECLRRHASSVGMKNPENLIKAWRSGLVYLLLDGFDELAPRIATGSRKRAQDLRNSAIGLVRRLLEETPANGSILLAGRNNYFDSIDELRGAVGAKKNWRIFELHDLDSEDLARFISDHGWEGGLPDWVPKKPLLISYVKQSRLIDAPANDSQVQIADPASGWDYLIDKICEREVEQVYVALEPEELRRIYGRLATFARGRSDSRGPLNLSDSKRAFIEVTGVEPEERSITAILRLPGLSGSLSGVETTELERGSRYFIDADLADCLCAADVISAVNNPYEYPIDTHKSIQHELGELGRSVAFARFANEGSQLIGDALRFFASISSDSARNLCSDIIGIMFSNSVSFSGGVEVSNGYFRKLSIEGGADFSSITFDTCGFEILEVDVVAEENMPKFQHCDITLLKGISTMRTYLSENIEANNVVDHAEVVDLSYDVLRNEGAPEEFLDLTSVIDKAFIQSRKGRQLAAMFRGRPEDRRSIISEILDKMVKDGWITISRRGGAEIVVPNMSKAAEAKAIIAKKDFQHYLVN
jgi:hypothetical protein